MRGGLNGCEVYREADESHSKAKGKCTIHPSNVKVCQRTSEQLGLIVLKAELIYTVPCKC